MIQSLPILELHSSDLTAHCLRSVKLRHEGKIHAEMPTAMYRGALADQVLCLLHDRGLDPANVNECLRTGMEMVEVTAQRENRPFSESVARDKLTIATEVGKVCAYYCARMVDEFRACRMIGCQVPIRCSISIDDEPIDFASHLDHLFRHADRTLVFDDWKWRDEAPTSAYLARSLQFGLYAYMLRHGEVLVEDEWVSFGEWPLGRWIHLPNFKPYARNGADYKAGEHRTLDRIIRAVPYDDACESFILAELTERVRMWRAGFFPTNPDPVGCFICNSKSFCPQMSVGGNDHE